MFFVPVSAWSSPAPSPESRMRPTSDCSDLVISARSRSTSDCNSVRASATSSGVHGSSPGRTASSPGSAAAASRALGTALGFFAAVAVPGVFFATTVVAPVVFAASAAPALLAVLFVEVRVPAALPEAAVFFLTAFLATPFLAGAFFATALVATVFVPTVSVAAASWRPSPRPPPSWQLSP